jgi:hypothetical protein
LGTIPKSNLKMTETVEKSIPLTHMQMITCFLSWLETDTWIKGMGLIIFTVSVLL